MEKKYFKIFIIGNSKEISKLYYLNRKAFFNFGKKYGLDDDELSDIYQEAFIALRKFALKGKMDTIKSTLKTYLFGIGKYMILNTLKEKNKKVSYEPDIFDKNNGVETIIVAFENNTLTLEQQLLRTHFNNLGKKCKKVLTLFYYQGLTIDEIIGYTDYKKSSVVRSQKSRCIKRLKEMIKGSKV